MRLLCRQPHKEVKSIMKIPFYLHILYALCLKLVESLMWLLICHKIFLFVILSPTKAWFTLLTKKQNKKMKFAIGFIRL